MIFSLFGKTGKTDSSKNNSGIQKPEKTTNVTSGQANARLNTHPESTNSSTDNRSQNTVNTRSDSTVKSEAQRELALATKAKIDAIESAMTLDFGTSPPAATSSVAPTLSQQNTQASLNLKKQDTNSAKFEPLTTVLPLDATTSIMLGGETGALSVEINTIEVAPIIEEVAILYANGQSAAASTALANAIEQDTIGPSTRQAWLMLFDLYYLMGKRTEFEALAIDFVSKFEISPPIWENPENPHSPHTSTPPRPRPSTALAKITLTALDDELPEKLSRLVQLAAKPGPITLDVSAVSSITSFGCASLLQTLQQIEKTATPTLNIVGLANLLKMLLGCVETGRRDPSDEYWMLLLETHRLLNQKAEFEEVSINYCITYEVSPPAWIAPPQNIRQDAPAQPKQVPLELEAESVIKADQNFELVGDLEGSAESELTRLMTYAQTNAHLKIYCKALRRVDFTAAGALLNTLVSLQGSGRKIEFLDLNHLVAALFIIMGIHHFAAITLRKL